MWKRARTGDSRFVRCAQNDNSKGEGWVDAVYGLCGRGQERENAGVRSAARQNDELNGGCLSIRDGKQMGPIRMGQVTPPPCEGDGIPSALIALSGPVENCKR